MVLAKIAIGLMSSWKLELSWPLYQRLLSIILKYRVNNLPINNDRMLSQHGQVQQTEYSKCLQHHHPGFTVIHACVCADAEMKDKPLRHEHITTQSTHADMRSDTIGRPETLSRLNWYMVTTRTNICTVHWYNSTTIVVLQREIFALP